MCPPLISAARLTSEVPTRSRESHREKCKLGKMFARFGTESTGNREQLAESGLNLAYVGSGSAGIAKMWPKFGQSCPELWSEAVV